MVDQYIPYDAETLDEVKQYYKVRCMEMNATLNSLEPDSNGVFVASLTHNNTYYSSIFIPPSLRGQGLLKKYAHLHLLTIDDCAITEALEFNSIPFTKLTGWFDFPEYKEIKEFYGNGKANRSQEFFMWHITHGCNYLSTICASDPTIKAYMLHPKFQSDVDFQNNWLELFSGRYAPIVSRNIIEYRKVANAYLCKPYTDGWDIDTIKEAAPIPFEDVRKMLLADKYQNYSDFMKYHYGQHKRSDELKSYFEKWMEYLNSI